jgi:hypothetical protein
VTTQLDASVGLKVESTYGTPVTVDHFLEFTDESFDWNPTFVQGVGSRVGARIVRAARRKLGKQMVTGDVTVEAGSKGQGILLSAAFGTVVSTQRATTGVYQHNFTPTTTDYLSSYTWQKGIPLIGGGATTAITIPGCVCGSIEFANSSSDKLMITTSWNGREVQTGVAYAAPSYPTPVEPLIFSDGSITIGGTVTPATTTLLATGGTAVANVRDISIKFDNNIDDGGFNLGGAGKRSRKPVIGLTLVTGKITVEYDSNTMRDALLAQTDLALVATWLGQVTIGSGSDKPALSVHLRDIRLEGELPQYNGGAPVVQEMDFTAFDDLSGNSGIVVSYVSLDSTP